MTTYYKKALLLLKCYVFHFDDFDVQEKAILNDTAARIEATDELQWAYDFIEKDKLTIFERTRKMLNELSASLNREEKLESLKEAWQAARAKGFISEMEAVALLRFARDWNVEGDFLASIKQ